MARKKKGRPISGWLVLDKPFGMGSTQAVGKIKWLFGAKKAGHAGTLDPLASGMLPIALGEATKTVNHVMDGPKTYHFRVEWGAQTNTDDKEGEVVESSDMRPERDAIEAIMPNFKGTIEQTPPAFSAIKIDGERAYALARDGQEVELKSREVSISRLEIIDIETNSCAFEVDCSKGTYVRSIARDMGQELGCFGHVSELRRVCVGNFAEEDLITLEDLLKLEGDFDALDEELLHILDALDDMLQVEVSEQDAVRIRSGNPVLLRGKDAPIRADEAVAVFKQDALALGVVEGGQFHPRKVFVNEPAE